MRLKPGVVICNDVWIAFQPECEQREMKAGMVWSGESGHLSYGV